MQSEGVQESRQALHKKQHSHGEDRPDGEHRPKKNEAVWSRTSQADLQHHCPQYLGQFYLFVSTSSYVPMVIATTTTTTKLKQRLTSMSQTQGPQAQVRGCVRDASKKVLDGVNTLLDRNLAHVKLELSK